MRLYNKMTAISHLLMVVAVCLAFYPAGEAAAECIWGSWSDSNGNHYCPPDCGGNPDCETWTPPPPPPPPQPDPADVAFQRAYALQQAGDLVEAEKYYLKTLQHNNRYTAAHNNLANIYRKWNQEQKATDHYLKAIQYASTDSDREFYRNNLKKMYLNLGYRYLNNGDFFMAESYFRSILGMYPGDREAAKGLDKIREREAVGDGNMRFNLEDYDGAIASYKEALRSCRSSCDYINKNITMARRNRENNRGNELFDREDYEAAIDRYRAALQYCRWDMDCEYIRQNISIAQQNIENRDRRRAVEKRNRDNRELEQEADRLASSGDLKRAEERIRTLIRRNPDNDYYDNKLGNNLLDQKRYKDAEQAYREGIRKDPGDAVIHYNLSLALYGQDHLKEAEKEAQKSLDLDPSYHHAQKVLKQLRGQRHSQNAEKLMEEGNFKEAEAKLRDVLAKDPGNANATITLGNGLIDKARLGDAEDIYREGIKHNPKDATMRYNLAVILKAKGRYVEAEEEAQKALEIDPSYKSAKDIRDNLQDKGFLDRKLDPIVFPAFNYIEESLIAANDRRKETASSVQDTYNSVREQASSAEYHSLLAEGTRGETAKRQAGKVFDSAGDNIGSTIDSPAVDGRRPEEPEETPKELLESPQWLRLDIDQRRAAATVAKKEKELANLHKMRESADIKPVKKAMVLVAIANTKSELFEAERKVKEIEVEKKKLRKSYKLGAITERKDNAKKKGKAENESK